MEDAEVRSFFLDSQINIVGNEFLREPQAQGYIAAHRHFQNSLDQAILQIPVGCGKTGLMSLLPFGISEGRVLIITPNLQIRDDVARSLDVTQENCFWGKVGALDNFEDGPFRAILDGRNANLADCYNSHFVITNIHQLASAADRWLPQFPDNFFDLIMVDEGHHNAAQSWQRVFERFPNAKIVSLTATPFRADGQEVTGNLIYRYPFARAMQRGYIKQLRSINAAPTEIYFTYQTDEHRHSLEEVMELREEAWFRNGVALSRETNISIVDASIQHLDHLRQSGFNHQIVASTCSINHAREVASLYRERGFQASEISSDMRPDQREAVMRDLKSGNLDCIVQVQILGEGFDHPPLSVAAIFKPYRSLSPYVQFVGRIMRVIVQNSPFHPDNEGFVVSHIGLQQDHRWNDFRSFDDDDEEFFRDMANAIDEQEEGINDPEEEVGGRQRIRPAMVVLDEVVDRFISDDFLDPTDEGAIEEALNQIANLLGMPPGDLGLTHEDLRGRLLAARRRADIQPRQLPVQPQDRRRERRRRLVETSRSLASGLLRSLELAPNGVELPRHFPELGSMNNIGASITIINRAVNEELGIQPGGRADLDTPDFDRVLEQMDTLVDKIEAHIRRTLEG